MKEKKNALESKLTELTGDHIPSSRSVIVLDEEDRGYCTPSTTTLTNPSTNCSVSEDEDEGMDSPGCMSNTSSISNLSHSESGISSLSSSSQFQFSPKPVVQPSKFKTTLQLVCYKYLIYLSFLIQQCTSVRCPPQLLSNCKYP